ncbi:MAG: MarR family transcriptional regulator [Solirubrobacteraceae bacterium]
MSRRKRKVFGQLLDEVRRSQTATARYDHAVAMALGLNLTDMRCVDVLHREGAVTAGRLAEETGLSSGAMTAALDRLERSGYAQRVRDPSDRRRVLVELTAKAAVMEAFYADHVAEAERLYHQYDVEQLELLRRFVRGSREFNEQHAAELERRSQVREE